MSADHYTIRSTTSAFIKKGLEKISLPKNEANQYAHNAAVLVGSQLRRLLTGVYNSGGDGPGMAKLMDATDNALTLRKNTDAHSIESVLQAARDVATAAGNQTNGSPTPPLIITREDAEVEAARENLLTQAIMGAKEGITEAITALVGSDITDAILRSADGTDFKGVDEYTLAELFEAALEGADRPGATEVLDQLVEAITFPFDFRKKCSANVELLRSKAAKMASYGITIAEPIFAIIIIANIDLASQDDYGMDFRQSMQTIRRQYEYNHVHDSRSLAFIMKELAAADGARNLRDAPNPNSLAQRGSAHAVQASVSPHLSRLCDEESSAYSASSGGSSAMSASSSDSDTSADTKDRRYRSTQRKYERHAAKKKMEKAEGRTKRRAERKIREEKQTLPIYKDCRHCERHQRRTPHPNYPEKECFFNKKYKGWRPRYACKIVGCEYRERIRFHSSKGGPTLTDSSSDDDSN